MKKTRRQDVILRDAVISLVSALELPDVQITGFSEAQLLQLLRIYKLIISATGNSKAASHWIRSPVTTLNARPVDLLYQEGGLTVLEQYLLMVSRS